MKKRICILLAVTLALSLSACGSILENHSFSEPASLQPAAAEDLFSSSETEKLQSVPEDISTEASDTSAYLSEEAKTDAKSETAETETAASSEGSSITDVEDLFDNPSLTVADLKSLDLSLMKVSSLTKIDQYIDRYANSNVEKNTYDNRSFRHEGSLLYYDDPEYDCLLGVDVSFFQKEIDWEAVRAQGISFAIIRAGFRGYGETGSLNEDEMFRQNIAGAKKAGLLVGVYFFSQATTAEEAEEEAAYALSLLDGMQLDLPLVFDAEIIRHDDARTDSCLLSQFTENALAFCNAVEAAGYSPMIYANLLFEGLIYDLERLGDIPIWFAGYDAVPLTPYHFTFWQYTETGTLDGVDEPVDINIWMRKKQVSD